MGYNSCIDIAKLKQAQAVVNDVFNTYTTQGTSFLMQYENVKEELSGYDKNHQCISAELDAFSDIGDHINNFTELIERTKYGIDKTIEAYGKAESPNPEFLASLASILGAEFAQPDVAQKINDGTINDQTIASDVTQFVNNMDEKTNDILIEEMREAAKGYWTEVGIAEGTYYPSLEYRNRATWRQALIENYMNQGYTEEAAKELAEVEMARQEMLETGADVVGEYSYDSIDEVQAELLEKYSGSQESTSQQSGNNGGGGSSYANTSSTSNQSSRSVNTSSTSSTASSTPSPQTTTTNQSITTPTKTETTKVETSTPEKPVIDDINSSSSVEDSKVETPITENNTSSNSQPVVEDNTPPQQSTEGIAENIENVVTNTKVPTNQTNSTHSLAGSINSIVSGNDSIPTLNPETEPSVGPDATLPTLDAEEVINQGELTDVTELPSTLDVVSIDKDVTPTTEVKTSAAPIALGLGATGLAAAAGIGGPKLIDNYKQKHNSFTFINKKKDEDDTFEDEEIENYQESNEVNEEYSFDPKKLLDEMK